MDTGTTFITISWISTSVGSVTYTITYLTGNLMISYITDDTNYTINGLSSDTSYRISIVPSMGMCQGEGKEIMVDTTDISTTDGKCTYSIYYTLSVYFLKICQDLIYKNRLPCLQCQHLQQKSFLAKHMRDLISSLRPLKLCL